MLAYVPHPHFATHARQGFKTEPECRADAERNVFGKNYGIRFLGADNWEWYYPAQKGECREEKIREFHNSIRESYKWLKDKGIIEQDISEICCYCGKDINFMKAGG